MKKGGGERKGRREKRDGKLRVSRTFQCTRCDRCTGKVHVKAGLKPSVDPVRTYIAHVRDVFPDRDAAMETEEYEEGCEASHRAGNLAVKTHLAFSFADA